MGDDLGRQKAALNHLPTIKMPCHPERLPNFIRHNELMTESKVIRCFFTLLPVGIPACGRQVPLKGKIVTKEAGDIKNDRVVELALLYEGSSRQGEG